MKHRFAVILAAALAGGLLVIAAGCGSASHPSAAQRQHQAQERAAEQRQTAAAQRRAHQSALYKECKAVAWTLDQRLTALDSRMAVGMQFASYGNAVGSARVAYDRMIRSAKQRGGVSNQCVNRVAEPLRRSLNAYIDANVTWNKCINDYSCSIDQGAAKRKVQNDWVKAGRLATRADDALAAMQPSS